MSIKYIPDGATEGIEISDDAFEKIVADKVREGMEKAKPKPVPPYDGNDPKLLIAEGLKSAKLGTQPLTITPEMLAALPGASQSWLQLIREGLRSAG